MGGFYKWDCRCFGEGVIGEEGVVYAADVHPLAIERAKGKIEREGMKNVKPMLANASETGYQTKV